MMSVKRKSILLKKIPREVDFLLFWLLETGTYISAIPEDHKWLSDISQSVKADLKTGDSIALIGDVTARLVFRGPQCECRNKEKFLESYMVAHDGEGIESNTVLYLLNDDEFIPPSVEEPPSPAPSPGRDMNLSRGKEMKEDFQPSEEEDDAPPETHGILAETHRLLGAIIEQNETTNDLLRAFLVQRRLSPGSELVDHAGKTFTIAEISHANPNVFAITLLKRLLGEEFGNVIIEPKGQTDLTPVRPDVVEVLKGALSMSFPFHSYSKVRRSINQAARDIRNRQKRLQRGRDK